MQSCQETIEIKSNYKYKAKKSYLIKKENALLILLMMGFFWLLILVYQYSADQFEYLGYYGDYSFSFFRFVIASLIAIFFTCYAFSLHNNFLRLTYIACLILLYYGELCSLVCTKDFNRTMIYIISLFLLLFKLIDRVKPGRKVVNKNTFRINNNTLFLLFIICLILFIPFLSFIDKINIKNLFLEDIYDSRSIFGNIGGTVVGYIKEPLARVLLPLVLIISIDRKKVFYIICSSLMILYIFLCGGLKSILFGFLCIIFFYKGSYTKKLKNFVIVLFLAELLGIILYFAFQIDTIISIYRRLFVLPPRLNQYYVEFFNNDWTYYRHSGLSWIADPRLKGMDISHFVGEYVVKTGTNANTGIFVEGYYSFGLIGGFLYLIIPLAIISYLKNLNFNNKFYGIFFVYIYYFNTSIFSTLILTHGLLLFLIVFSVFVRNTETNKLVKKSGHR